MTAIETAKAVLAKASLFDQTFATPDLGIAVAWSEALGEMDQTDACTAVTDHYRAQSRRIMPADVIAGVRAIRKVRILDAHDLEPASADPDDVRGYIAAVREHRRAIGDGNVVPLHSERNPAGLKRMKDFLESAVESLPEIPAISEEERRGGVSG